MALESFCVELEKNMVFNERGVRQYYGECAVGSVATRIIVLKEEFDRVYVEIRWSGKDYSLDKKGSRTVLGSKPDDLCLLAESSASTMPAFTATDASPNTC